MDKNDARLFLDWNDVPGADSYVVQIKDGGWKDLPTDKYSLDGSLLSQMIARESDAMIGGLDFDKTYEFRFVSVRGDDRSRETQGVEIKTAPPFYGRQKDHTVQYELGTLAASRQGGDPHQYSPESAIRAGITEGIKDWNNSPVGTGTPNLLICESGVNCPTNAPNDRRVVTVQVTDKQGDCSRGGIACFKPALNLMTDRDGYMYGGTIYIEEPAKGGSRSTERYLWTNDPTMHGERLGDGIYMWWEYLPTTVMHEFGHTLGLRDLDASAYDKYLMGPSKKAHQSIPQVDVDYLDDVYRNHSPHERNDYDHYGPRDSSPHAPQ